MVKTNLKLVFTHNSKHGIFIRQGQQKKKKKKKGNRRFRNEATIYTVSHGSQSKPHNIDHKRLYGMV